MVVIFVKSAEFPFAAKCGMNINPNALENIIKWNEKMNFGFR